MNTDFLICFFGLTDLIILALIIWLLWTHRWKKQTRYAINNPR